MSSENDFFSDEMGLIWVQPDGPNTTVFPLFCYDIDGLDEPGGPVTTRLCRDANGNWQRVHRSQGSPGDATATIETWLPKTQGWLQKQADRRCPMSIYLHHTQCPPFDVFLNYDAGQLLQGAIIETRSKGNLVRTRADPEAGTETPSMSFDLNGGYPAPEYWPLVTTVRTAAEDEPFRDIAFCNKARCAGVCGNLQDVCEFGIAVPDSATSPSLAEAWYTVNGGAAWAAMAAGPFIADEDIASTTCFYIDRETIRVVVARGTTDGANPAEIGYADFDTVAQTFGAWHTVNVGTTVGEYVMHGGAMFSLDGRHIWLCTDKGAVYFSDDNALTWIDQNAPTPSPAETLYCIHFVDANYGICGGGTTGASSVFLYTSDGGEHWNLGTGPVAQIITGVSTLDSNRLWSVHENGTVYYSINFGVGWVQRVLPTAATALGNVMFVDHYAGAIVGNHNDGVDDYGIVYRTFNGGANWEAYVAPTAFDSALSYYGLNAVWMCSYNEIYAIGEVSDSVGLILELENVKPS